MGLDARGYVSVDEFLETTQDGIFAAGDVNGRSMLLSAASHEGWIAATNAVHGSTVQVGDSILPVGSFTDPEYAKVGLAEPEAAAAHRAIVTARTDFGSASRPFIDRRAEGFCRLIADPNDGTILGVHVVGERAVETAQIAAVGMAAGLTVEQLAAIPLSYPTYGAIVGQAADAAAREAGRPRSYRHPDRA